MKKFHFIIVVFLLSVFLYGMDYTETFFIDKPAEVIQGDLATIEVIQSTSLAGIYNLYLFYRGYGMEDYKVVPMKREGYHYYAKVETNEYSNGQLEYYIGVEDPLGRSGSIPQESPQLNPYILAIAPAASIQDTPVNSMEEIVILSPEPGAIISYDELTIAASITGVESKIDQSRMNLLVDGVNVTNLSEFNDGIITYVPKNIRRGHHNVELNIYNPTGDLIAKKEWSFRSRDTYQPILGIYSRGLFFIDNRYVDVANNDDNYFRTGGEISGTFSSLDYKGRLLISSEEDEKRQPVNIYNGQLRYFITENNDFYLNLGDFTPFYNPLVLQNKRMRGVQAGLEYGVFTFDFITAQLYRAIEGDTTSLLNFNGTYEQNLLAFRPGLRFGNNMNWNLNLINAKEDAQSIAFGGNAKEALVIGSDLSLNFDKKRIIFDASIQASINNSDAGGEEVTFDELVEIDSSLADEDLAETAYNFLKSTGFISMTGGLNPIPSIAMEFNTILRYYNNYFKIKYFNIDQNFVSPGNPFMLKDVQGIYLSDRIRLLENKMFLNLFFRSYKNNSSADDLATNKNELGTSISYFPSTKLPSVTFGFTSINRSNDISRSEITDTTHLYLEDNSTQRINFSSSYNFDVKKIKNIISFNLLSYNNDDAIYSERKVENTSYNFGLRSKFEIPLTSQLSFYQLNKSIGDIDKRETNINGISVGLEYQISNLLEKDLLRPFINLSFQNIDSETLGDFSRNRYAGGIVYQNPVYGIFSIRYSQYIYEQYTDTVINALYQYNF